MPRYETLLQAANRPRPADVRRSPAQSPRRRAAVRQRDRGTWRRHGLAGIAVLAIAGAGSALVALDARPRELRQSALALIERATTAAGFIVLRVEVSGNRYTSARDVERAIGVGPPVSQLGLDLPTVRRRIEALPWVRTAVVRRSLPDGLIVDITERKPVALWRQPGREILIDSDGRALSEVARGTDIGLPVLVGEGAGATASGLLALLAGHPQIERRLAEAHRIEDRRWTLRLANGLLVHLPADGVAAALAWLDTRATGSVSTAGLLDSGLEVIDLRVAGQLVVQGGHDRSRDAGPSAQRTARVAFPGGE